jgi:Lrp/AsnC family leucine-responsive transcriptional regulator
MPASTLDRTDRRILDLLQREGRLSMDRLLKQAGVIDAKSNFVLERIKDTTALPLAHLG